MINARGPAVSPPAAPRFFSPPLSVAIVGAGPAGIHAAGALAELAPGTKTDVFERLPTPYGLVRYGLAPGTPSPKSSPILCTPRWSPVSSGCSATWRSERTFPSMTYVRPTMP